MANDSGGLVSGKHTYLYGNGNNLSLDSHKLTRTTRGRLSGLGLSSVVCSPLTRSDSMCIMICSSYHMLTWKSRNCHSPCRVHVEYTIEVQVFLFPPLSASVSLGKYCQQSIEICQQGESHRGPDVLIALFVDDFIHVGLISSKVTPAGTQEGRRGSFRHPKTRRAQPPQTHAAMASRGRPRAYALARPFELPCLSLVLQI
jgi:hypothetical protein